MISKSKEICRLRINLMRMTTHPVSDGTSGQSVSTETDADIVPEKRRRRGAHHKPRPPRKNNPPATIQLSLALQSELKKLQQVAARGSGVSKAEWDKVCETAHKAISLLQPGSRTPDVAATFTSHRGQYVLEIFAMDGDDNCKNGKCGKRGIR